MVKKHSAPTFVDWLMFLAIMSGSAFIIFCVGYTILKFSRG